MNQYDLFAIIFVCGTVFTTVLLILSYKTQSQKRLPSVIDADLLEKGFRRVVVCWVSNPDAEEQTPGFAWRHVSELRADDLWAAKSPEKDPQ